MRRLLACATAASFAALPIGVAGAESADVEGDPTDGHADRRYAGRDGSTGGLFVADPDSGPPGSLRLQLVLDGAPRDDFLRTGTEISQTRQALSASWTPLAWLELFGALHNRGISSDDATVPSQHALGEWALGVKAFTTVVPLVHAGGGVRVALRDDAAGGTIDLGATSIALQGALSVDLRERSRPAPFVGRLDVEYLFDNGAVAVEGIEAARYAALVDPPPASEEDAHLLTRIERYALGVSRIDRVTLGLGFETPLEVVERLYVHPLLEWRLAVPVNRQGYDCPIFTDADGAGTPASDRDGCVAVEGFATWPMRLTAGLRVMPPVDGLSLALAVDWGLTATDRFVHELAPVAPVVVLFALGFDFGAKPEPPPKVIEVVAPAPARGRVRGSVHDAKTGAAIVGAFVRVVGAGLGAFASDTDGSFATEPLAPGDVVLEVEHTRYAKTRCTAHISDAGGDVETRCDLEPLSIPATLMGRIVDAFGGPVAGALVTIEGPAGASLSSDGEGRFASEALAPGDYRVRVESGAHLVRAWALTVTPEQTTRLDVVLIARPTTPGVRVRAKRVVADALVFAPESTELGPEARLATAELADLLLRTPELGRIRVDAGGESALVPARVRAIVDALVAGGVPDARIVLGGAAGRADAATISIAE